MKKQLLLVLMMGAFVGQALGAEQSKVQSDKDLILERWQQQKKEAINRLGMQTELEALQAQQDSARVSRFNDNLDLIKEEQQQRKIGLFETTMMLEMLVKNNKYLLRAKIAKMNPENREPSVPDIDSKIMLKLYAKADGDVWGLTTKSHIKI